MEHISIERIQQEKNFFEVLQEESLAQLQELSGNVWTDYNLHDPGVTILEQLNYALWEFDYRLGFDIQDYLTSGDSFDPKQSMLFPPDEVFTTVPVTPKDYRLLILSSVENVSDVKVIVNKEACSYDFVLDAYLSITDSHCDAFFVLSITPRVIFISLRVIFVSLRDNFITLRVILIK